MTTKDIESIKGKRVIVNMRKPDVIQGIVSGLRPCQEESHYAGIILEDGTKISFGNMESIKVIE
ncbi:MAG: hypothetical protein IKR33_04275 [Bacteroidales bacterium]|nr:hypothetical protein [Bacteroidales bacterium]